MQRKPTKIVPKKKDIICPNCDGIGKVGVDIEADLDLGEEGKICPDCRGTGQLQIIE